MKYLLLSFLFLFSFSVFAQKNDKRKPKTGPKTRVETPLVKAVRAKNLPEVKRLVEAGARVNENPWYDNRFRDPVDIAIQMNYQEIALFLLEKGASSRFGLCGAIQKGDTAWVEKLINYGFDCYDGVLYAVKANNPPMVRLLIQKDFRVDFEQQKKRGAFQKRVISPLDEAISIESEEMILDLVKGGANKEQAFSYAVQNNRIKLGEHLIDLDDNRGMHFLQCFEYQSITLAQYCVAKGVDKNMVNQEGYNAYHFSVESGFKEGMDYCVNELKLNPLQKTASGQTALMLVASSGNLPVFKELFESQKSTMESEDMDGKTVLFYALGDQSPAILEYLVLAGANINHQDKKGNTAIMYSALKESAESYQILKQRKPDLSLKNKNGENIISFLMHSFPGAVKEILEMNDLGASLDVKSAYGVNASYYAMSVESMELLVRLKTAGVSLDAFNSKGERPDCFNPEIIRYVIANGCNPNRGDDKDETYLWEAIGDNQIDLALFLIQNGADVNWKKRGYQPMVFMIMEKNNLSGLKILVENGANLNVTDLSGRTPLDLAEKKEEEFLSYLKSKGAMTRKELKELEIMRSKEITKLDQLITDKNIPEVMEWLNKYPDVVLSKTQVSGLALLSIEKENLPLLQRLIEKEGINNINQASNFGGKTLLHIAAGNENPDLVRLLINQGADFRKKDVYNKLPIDYAKSKEVKQFLKRL